ncbi:hypothetical protein BpHYR1_000282 [Brachionus plicatilis]|uniref:Uncharacterized protein n=1 Tax=Brachionus plicatilis TaxID=10195 RepID=A0A3M7TAW4_BRAPC|nr:hypothetical protein BpHYR1_000282 [Brachionus plicatilis]
MCEKHVLRIKHTHGKANTAGTKGYEQSSFNQTIRYNLIGRPISKLHPMCIFGFWGACAFFSSEAMAFIRVDTFSIKFELNGKNYTRLASSLKKKINRLKKLKI